jgi:hypothetical protein
MGVAMSRPTRRGIMADDKPGWYVIASGLFALLLIIGMGYFIVTEVRSCAHNTNLWLENYKKSKVLLIDSVTKACEEELDCRVLSCDGWDNECLVKSNSVPFKAFTIRCEPNVDNGCYIISSQ